METDYPHGDGTFPHSMANAAQLLDGLDDDARYKIMQGNEPPGVQPRLTAGIPAGCPTAMSDEPARNE